MKFEFSRQVLEKWSNLKVHENLSSGSRIVACGQTDGHTYMTKLIVAFRSLVKAPKKIWIQVTSISYHSLPQKHWSSSNKTQIQMWISLHNLVSTAWHEINVWMDLEIMHEINVSTHTHTKLQILTKHILYAFCDEPHEIFNYGQRNSLSFLCFKVLY